MCIDKDEIMDNRSRVLARKRYVHKLSVMVVWGYFYVGTYKYARPGSLSDLIDVFKVTCGARYNSKSIIESIAAADMKAPIFLSRRETSDYVASA